VYPCHVLAEGTASIRAPTTRFAYTELATPEVVLRHSDGFAQLLEQCAGLEPVRCAVVHPCDRDALRGAVEAAERGLTLAHQTHWGTLCETVEQALDLVRRVRRPNFGITYEPANLRACGGPYGPDAIAALAPCLVNVYFQNVRVDPDSPIVFPSRRRGPTHVRYVPIDDPSGIDIRPLIDRLHAEGYEGWFTVHEPLFEGQNVDAAMRLAADFLLPRMAAR